MISPIKAVGVISPIKVSGMWRVQVYVWICKVFGKHPRVGNRVHQLYLFRKLLSMLANFDRGFSDRLYMTKSILPALTAQRMQRVLFVGCRAYTARYGRKFARAGIEYWTTEIDPEAAIWGEPRRHIIGDITKIDDLCAPESFDAVLLNGVFGHGVDNESAMNRAVTAISQILKPGGILLIGWNSNKKHPDPMALAAVDSYFRHECVLPLPLRKTFPDTDHVYDWLTKPAAAEPNAGGSGLRRL
jgi:SAM-dependent methyltransferase